MRGGWLHHAFGISACYDALHACYYLSDDAPLAFLAYAILALINAVFCLSTAPRKEP